MAFYRLVHREKKFVLCVDPKCGCTTVKHWFADMFDTPVDPHQLPAGSVMGWNEFEASGFRKVWFIRDPLRRLVSFYYQFVVRRPEAEWCYADASAEVGLHGATFAEFVETIAGLHRLGQSLQHHLQPQTRRLAASDVDVIVKIEELHERSDELMQLLSISARPGHANRQDGGAGLVQLGAELLPPSELASLQTLDYSSFWTDELRALAVDVYRSDWELYANF